MPSKPQPEVTATLPDHALKKKLGPDVNIREAFTEEAIAAADSAIADSRKDFFGDAADNLQEMEAAYGQAAETPAKADKPVKQIERLSHSLKGRSETLGFELLAHVSKSLYGFCSTAFRSGEKEQLIVLRKHLDTLQLIVREKMQGDGGETGKALIAGLRQLNAKYA